MIPVIVKLCESPSRAGGLLMINYFSLKLAVYRVFFVIYAGFVSFRANLSCQHMEPLQIVANTNQRPFPSHGLQSP